MTIVILKDTQLIVVKVLVIGDKADNRNCQIPVMEDVRLNSTNRRQPSTAEELGANSCRLRDGNLRNIPATKECRL